MPSTSKKQHNFMAAVANNPAFAKKAGVPQSVGKEFSNADKGRKFSKGGDMKESKAMAAKEMNFMKKKGAPKSMIKHEMAEAKGKPFAKGGGISSSLKAHAAAPASKAHGMKKGGSVGTTKMGAVRTAAPSRDGVATQGKTKGMMVKMARGGKTC
jgi:hypothetical protein